jgi:hypothetical protein
VAGVQAVGARRLSPRVDFFAGAGATAGGSRTVRGVGYERWRAHGFAALEWRVGRKLSLLVQSDAASRLVSDVQSYPGVHWLIHAGARLRVSESTGLDLGLTENVKSQQATADFALHAALTLRP